MPYTGKFHVAIDSVGYIIAQKNGVRQYQKKRAPAFVNKFGGGDSSYRDATFWQYMVQTNWRNGAKQLKFDDPGKFWKSSDVDTTILEQLTLSKKFESAGQLASGIKVNAMEAWRSSANWWDANYGYRQQITVTAVSLAPAGYPIKVTIDTAALETATHLRSDRKDWRILYFNGSGWVDLTRDYVSTTATFFPLQAAIAAGTSDSNYYAYYGYASESTTKQASTEAEYNGIYNMYGSTPDSNYKGVYHMREGSGTSIADDSASANTGTLSNGSWGTDGQLGRYVQFTNASATKIDVGNGSDFSSLGSMTLQGWFNFTVFGDVITKLNGSGQRSFRWTVTGGGLSTFYTSADGINYTVTDGVTALSTSTWYHLAVTYDGVNTTKIYVNGVLDATGTGGGAVFASTANVLLGFNPDFAGNLVPTGKFQHVSISNTVRTSFPFAMSQANQPTTGYGSETTTQPPSSTFDLYAGGSDGLLYKWDGTTTWTSQFDTRQLVWYETGNDANRVVGDTGGVETAQAQGFQVAAAQTVSGCSMYLKKAAGTPGNITVRIETNNAGVPSGTLVNASATGTITAFTTASYAWVEVTFAGTFALAATTTYHVVLKTAAAANDQNYTWAADASSPSFSSGANSHSEDGGSTWTADSTTDMYFRLLAQSTSINAMKVTSVGGTQKLYMGTGNPTGQTNGDARLYSFDGTTYALAKTFATATESMITAIEEYTANTSVHIGVGPQARDYSTTDFSSYTLSKDINIPQNPGYIYAIKEYNRVLHVGGGSPEFLPTQFFNGFLNVYDTTAWNILYPFDFTVIKSLEFYDAYLFMGTYRGDLYVYDTATLNPLFNFIDQYNYMVEVKAMKYFNDKLYLGLYPQLNSNETNVGVWLFDRRGLSLAHTISGVTGYRCFTNVNGSLMVGTGDSGYVYKLSLTNYATQGWYQSSYYDANLPSIDKLYNNVNIKHDPLDSGQSIVVYYKFKESDSWTTLGTSSTVDATTATFSFATGTYSKKISLKVELNTTDVTASPKLTEVVMQYSLYPARKWQWTLRLKAKTNQVLLDNTIDTRSATTIRTTLEDLLTSQELYTYIDVDGTNYSVLVNEIDNSSWVVNQNNSGVNEDEVIVSLLEA